MSAKKWLFHLAALAIFVCASIIYFYPQLQGKQLPQSDIMQYTAMAHEAKQYYEDTGHAPLWTNAMFSGMPTYQITGWPYANKMGWLEQILELFFSSPIGFFIFAQFAFYIALILIGVNRWIAIPFAIAFGFATTNIFLFEAGHNSKLRTLFSTALVISGLIITYRKQYLLGGVTFCAGLALNIYTNHPQITYYLALCLLILFVMEGYQAFRNKTMVAFGKATGILAIAAFLAVAASAYTLYSTLEYSSETMRGKPTLSQTTDTPTSSSQTDGLEWEYAMRWSNGIEDVLATAIPRAAGGASGESMPESSQWNDLLRKNGMRIQDAPLYWGALPFTSGPAYFGAVLIFLFILGALILRGHLKWWLVVVVVLTILLSMGKHFAVLSKLFFDYIPVYNKFRAPSSILSITAVFIPILGALGVSELLKKSSDRTDIQKKLIWSYIGFGGLLLLMALIGTSFFDFTSDNDARYAQMGIMDTLLADRKALFRADAFRSFLYVSLVAGVLWAALKGWIRKTWMLVLPLTLLILLDLWGVGRRYIKADDFITQRQLDNTFAPDAADQEILKDKDLHYRVHDLTADPFNNSHRAYFHHMIGGYHAAKLQRYQDIIERYLSKNDETVLNMLNARYIIVPGDNDQPAVRRNLQALGNAWFVENIRVVNSAEEEIEALENLDPEADAIVHKDFEPLVKGFDPVKGGTIALTEYSPDRLKYEANAIGDQLAIFSEVWYGPHKGWHAYIDGQPVELLRADYILRALNVPNGKHEVLLVFHPDRYYLLKTVSLIVSIVILIGLLGVLFYFNRRQRKTLRDDDVDDSELPGTMNKASKSIIKGKSKKK